MQVRTGGQMANSFDAVGMLWFEGNDSPRVITDVFDPTRSEERRILKRGRETERYFLNTKKARKHRL